MLVFVVTQVSWKQHLGYAVLISAYLVLCLVRGFLQWQNHPRFISLRSAMFVVYPVIVGLLNLFLFNYLQYMARTSSDMPRIASAAEVFTFNLVVVLAYAAFVGIVAWKRRAAFPQASPK